MPESIPIKEIFPMPRKAPFYTMVEHDEELYEQITDLVNDAVDEMKPEDRFPSRAGVIRQLIRAAHKRRKNNSEKSAVGS